ncbi:MAG: hypothetical protein ABH804_02590 [archaeon]
MAQAKKKKRFFEVEIPIIKKQTQLQAYEIEDLNGRFINYDLTRLLRGKSAILQLKIKTEGKEITAKPMQIKILPYFLRKMVKKGTSYAEDSFSAECKDAKVKIKPILVTRRKVSRVIRKTLREKCKEELINYIKEKNSESIFEEIISNRLQKTLSLKLKKIYPLSLCEIRVLKVIENK